MQKFTKELIKKYGDESIIIQNEVSTIVSTGSVALDVSIGTGGIPLGKFTEIYGPESGGKTTICLTIARNALRDGLRVLYIDVENSLDLGYVQDIIKLDTDYLNESLVIFQPRTAEDAFTVAEKGIEDGFDLIFFDSVAAISPLKELDDKFEDHHVGLAPRMVAKFLRRNSQAVRINNIAFVFTNQVRDNIGSLFGGFVTPAGHALRHYLSLRIYISKGKEIETKEGAIGQYVNFVIKKNKVGVPNRQATTNIIYGQGIDTERDIMSFAKLLGIILSRGPFYNLVGEDGLLCPDPGLENAIQFLKSNPQVLDKIINMCYNVSKVEYPQHGYKYLLGMVQNEEDQKD